MGNSGSSGHDDCLHRKAWLFGMLKVILGILCTTAIWRGFLFVYIAKICWTSIRSCLCCLLPQLHWRVSWPIHSGGDRIPKPIILTTPAEHFAVWHPMKTTSGWATPPETCKSRVQDFAICLQFLL